MLIISDELAGRPLMLLGQLFEHLPPAQKNEQDDVHYDPIFLLRFR
jgi:hypothetical protein